MRAVPRDKVLGHGDGRGSLGWLERLELVTEQEAARSLHGAIGMEEEQRAVPLREASVRGRLVPVRSG